MRNPQRIAPIMERLTKLWEKYPDLRFGQMVENIILSVSPGSSVVDIETILWNWEEDQWNEAINKWEGVK